MNIKEVLEYWKLILAFIAFVVTSTVGVIAWAEDQKTLIRAEQQLIHSKIYQEDRVQRKRDQIQENLKMVRLLQSTEQTTEQEQAFISSLTDENMRLLREIEEIEDKLHTK